MKEKQRVASPAPGRPWTKPEHYMGAMSRKRIARRARRQQLRTEPERPRLLLSTVPFFVLIGLLAVLAMAIMIAAYPGSQPVIRAKAAAPAEQGVAQRGWFQEAQKDMR